jgi:Xaa-Pro dipeptidase
MRENECVGLVSKVIYDLGSAYLPGLSHLLLPDAVGSASPAQRDAYARCLECMDQAIALVKPGSPGPT